MFIKKILNKIAFLFNKKSKPQINWRKKFFYKKNIEQAFFNCFGYNLDLKNPQTFSEKMQWLRVYDNTSLKTKLSDKYLVREWVKSKIGEKYLIPLLGVYNNFDEIDFKKLPNSFVIKCNHGCGYNIIVRNKKKLNLKETKLKINKWMKENYAYLFGEYQYKKIEPKIIIEKYLENINSDVYDYKFFCFNGKPKYILHCFDRASGILKNSFYDLSWKKQNFVYTGQLYKKAIAKPKNLSKMTEVAKILSQNFKHVRVDLYNINGKIYFGEMTFTSYGGYFHFDPPEWNLKLGKMLDLKK